MPNVTVTIASAASNSMVCASKEGMELKSKGKNTRAMIRNESEENNKQFVANSVEVTKFAGGKNRNEKGNVSDSFEISKNVYGPLVQ